MTAKKQKREFLHALPAPLFPLKEASLITLRAQAPENKRRRPEILKALVAKYRGGAQRLIAAYKLSKFAKRPLVCAVHRLLRDKGVHSALKAHIPGL